MVATVDGRRVVIGARSLVASAPAAEPTETGAVAHVEIDGAYAGAFVLGDPPRKGAAEFVRALSAGGLSLVIASGDRYASVESVAREVGISEFHAEVDPAGKAALIARLRGPGRVVAMVGDGVNDAPALAAADVGMALGTGSDIALEAAPVTLMRGGLTTIVGAILVARAARRVIRQNLFWAFGYNGVAMAVAAAGLGGHLAPMAAAFAMAFSSVTVVGNSLRLRRA